MKKGKKFSSLWIFIPIIFTCFFTGVLIFYLIDPTIYKNIIQEKLSSSLEREVYIGNAKINLFKGFGIVFEDIRIKDSSFLFDLFQSETVLLKLKLSSLLRKEVQFKEINFYRPKIQIIKYKNGNLNITNIKKEKGESEKKLYKIIFTLFGSSITFRDGEIRFLDESMKDPFKTEIKELNLHLYPASSNNLKFRLKGKLIQGQKQGSFSLTGAVHNISEDFDLKNAEHDFQLEIQAIDISYFWPYLKRFVPFKKFSADLDLSLNYQGKVNTAFTVSSKLRLKEPILDYPQVFFYTLKPKWLNISFNLNYDLKNLIIPKVLFELPELSIKSSGKIYSIGSKDMGIEAEAQSNPFDLSQVKKYIPLNIIAPYVSNFISKTEAGGEVRIVSVKLSGKIPEIEHCDRPINSNVLSIELMLNGARLKFPWNFPYLEELKGALIFKKGNLYLNEIEGRILNSRFKRLNGTFYNFLNTSTLTLNSEGQLNISDLKLLINPGILSQYLSKILSNINTLSGKADYQIYAKCILKEPFNIEHKGIFRLSKIRVNHRDIPFDLQIDKATIDLSNDKIIISDTKMGFGDSSFLINGKWKMGKRFPSFDFKGRGNLDLKIISKLFKSPVIPKNIGDKLNSIESLSGMGELTFKINNLPENNYYYNIGFVSRGVSLKQKGISFPLIFKEGIINFSNNDLTFSDAKFILDKSFLELNGSFKNGYINLSILGNIELRPFLDLLRLPLYPDQIKSKFKGIKEISGQAECNLKFSGKIDDLGGALKEGVIRLKRISLKHEDINIPIENVEGSILLKREKIHIDRLKGGLGDSQIEIKGSIPRNLKDSTQKQIRFPLSFNFLSNNLDLDSIYPKREKKETVSLKRLADWLRNLTIDGRFKITSGIYKSLQYQDMIGEIKTVGNKILLQPFQSKLDGGDIWGEGWIEPVDKGLRFEIKPRISNIELKSFLPTLLSLKQEEKILISGRLHIYKVELRGEGESFENLKGSLNGSLRLEIDNGVIEKFNILSKIFSILNVSQIFSGRLPDLKTKGLAYHKITANIHLKNGVAYTEDLVVESDAMRITMVGRLDLVKNLIDIKIGVHPLVTVDKILSNIPLAGYILTGKDKAFLSYFYEVKGNLDDPKIEAIPLKTIGETFLGVIKRLLETPIRPFKKSE